jgi:hypothetical protein
MHELEPIESYLEKLTEYNQEQLDNVKKIRTTYDYMTFEQWQFLLQQGVVERFVKLKKPRTLWLDENGFIHYLNHYRKWYQCVGKFKETDE